MKKRWIIIVVVSAIFGLFYLTGPYVAGMRAYGYRMGPVIYPESLHETLYIMGHESVYDQKPRLPLDEWMYYRPLFYGLPRRLKSEPERAAYIEAVRARGNRVDRLIEQNERLRLANQ